MVRERSFKLKDVLDFFQGRIGLVNFSALKFSVYVQRRKDLIISLDLSAWVYRIGGRLARLEGRAEELSKRLDEGLSSVNRRIDDLRNDMNHRFAELSKRIDDLKWFFYVTWGVTWGLLLAILSLLIR